MDNAPLESGAQARISCPVHGASPVAFACRHIAAVREGEHATGFYTGGPGDGAHPVAWCDRCMKLIESPVSPLTIEEMLQPGNTQPMCATCYELHRDRTGIFPDGSFPDADGALAECQHNFGDAPRRFPLRLRMGVLLQVTPGWQMRSDDLRIHFDNYQRLLREGRVTWGAVVQANTNLFQWGVDEDPSITQANVLPGAIVFSTATEGVSPLELRHVAAQVFALKNTQPADPEMARLAEHLTEETHRDYGIPVPRALSPGPPCLVSTTNFQRSHLPGQHLIDSVFPVVVSDTAPHVCTVLPRVFWPRALCEAWERQLPGGHRLMFLRNLFALDSGNPKKIAMQCLKVLVVVTILALYLSGHL